MKYSSSRIRFLNWTIDTLHIPVYDRVAGPVTRLNVQISRKDDRVSSASPPHGLIGQGFDGRSSEPRRGAIDKYPDVKTTSFTTRAIEGRYTDYRTMGPFDTRFKFLRFMTKSSD